ncbi:MAG TPA: M1 family aminopeptidase [Bryobacteraceae bacterium]
MRWVISLLLLSGAPVYAGTAADIARAVRENTFDSGECYRVRDLTIVKEDLKIYLTDGHLIFSKPVAGKRIAAVFEADVEGGDAEALLLPPDRAERKSLASYTGSPNLDEHFRSALFLFTGDDYAALIGQLPNNPANKKTPEIAPLMEERWTSTLQNLSASYQTRLTLDLLGGGARRPGLFAALIEGGAKSGNFDLIYDPDNPEQILAGQVAMRQNMLYFDTWTSFAARSARRSGGRQPEDLSMGNYRIEATVNPDLTLSAVARAKVRALADGVVATAFEMSPQLTVSEVKVDGRPAETLDRESMRFNLTRGGQGIFLVVPPEPLREGRDYEFEFHYSGQVIHDAGDRVYYVSARAGWYPMHGLRFADFDLQFRYPRDLDLVTPGDVVEDRSEGEWRITRRRTSAPIRLAGFNLGNYEHAKVERGGYVVDVCANRSLERVLQQRLQAQAVPAPMPPGSPARRRMDPMATVQAAPPPPNPLERLDSLATEVASALEFMASKFGPPALPHLTVSPIPGAFGQGFPGLIYLSTLSYLKEPLRTRPTPAAGVQSQMLFFEDLLQAHETAHQWWGNRISAATYRDYWLMEALANYSALLYLEKVKGSRAMDMMLDSYRTNLLEKSENGQTIESAGPIVLGVRLESSIEPRAWRAITYGKGSWIFQMLRRRMGDERFFSMLDDVLKRYDRKDIGTETFREVAAEHLPPKTDDPKLESFFDQWVYGTGIPTLKMTYALKGKAPALRLVGTITQSDVDEEFSALVPVEIQAGRGRTLTQWVRTGAAPTTFTVNLQQAPVKVLLDPHNAVLRK